jgi:hypothetical protein
MPDCPASGDSGQSGTGTNRSGDAGNGPVPEKGDLVLYRNPPVPDWDDECRNADAGGINLNAHAQLCDKGLEK